ncbi:hypothetical protein [Prosthecomicrobium hirschii]|uniref:hypothetical protein n=1 Tax=Prosthecodimorpha hirschii TaxID=665126 RepID=UPI00221E4030|nr:hypothetical protein [Prosthecomicrobium hirschii]MCW1844211.1 hypothetical protein [Prosthecomicrobium hirschii]
MSKTVTFKNPNTKVAPVPEAEDWVKSRVGKEAVPDPEPAPVVHVAPAEPMKRLTIDVPMSLHRKLKTKCAGEGEKMADVLRRMLDEFVKS